MDEARWEVIADAIHAAGWTWGHVAMVTAGGTLVHVADAHRDDGHRYVAHAETKLAAFVQLKKSLPAETETVR